MIDSLFSAAKGIFKLHARYDDDIVDRLHHRYTVSFLVLSAVLVTTTQYIGTPIHCWCPAYFTSNHQQVQFSVLNNDKHIDAALDPESKTKLAYFRISPFSMTWETFLNSRDLLRVSKSAGLCMNPGRMPGVSEFRYWFKFGCAKALTTVRISKSSSQCPSGCVPGRSWVTWEFKRCVQIKSPLFA